MLLWLALACAPNDVTTGASERYPELRTQRFRQPLPRVEAAVWSAIDAQGWQDCERAQTLAIECRDGDATVRVWIESDHAISSVHVRSFSERGGGHAQRIVAFQQALLEAITAR